MQTAVVAFKTPTSGQGDLFFKCGHCSIPLVVPTTAAGMTLRCQSCGKPTIVPHSPPANSAIGQPAPVAAERVAELQRHLKENESQRTEINGYINQLSIQLHRWQLRLQTLDERNKELTGQMTGATGAGNSGTPG